MRSADKVTACLGLGSNLGDRLANLNRAIARLDAAAGIRVASRSGVYETKPVESATGQPDFLNMAVTVETTCSPAELLELTGSIEHALGRIRPFPGAPRTVDIDLLLFGGLVRTSPDPVIPHPRMHERLFVLAPLFEIAPDHLHPRLGVTVATLLDRVRSRRDRRGVVEIVT